MTISLFASRRDTRVITSDEPIFASLIRDHAEHNGVKIPAVLVAAELGDLGILGTQERIQVSQWW